MRRTPDHHARLESPLGDRDEQRADRFEVADDVFEEVERKLRARLLVERERVGRATDLN